MTFAFDPASLSLPKQHFIGGEYVSGADAMELTSPSTGKLLGAIPCADAALVDRAVQSARNALETSGWAGLQPRARLRALHAWADLIEKEAETLAKLEAICSSRPYAAALVGDVMVTAEQIRFFAEFADKEAGTLVPTADTQMGFISAQPYGVVGAITPWNFPLSMAAWKLGPALAAGNAVVLKPSEMTPYSTLHVAALSVKAGIPAGLVNIVLGDGPVTGAALVAHPGIDKVSFTGSTRAGSQIMENIARSGIKPMTLELGGKSPQVVFADADMEVVLDSLEKGILPNAGQFCVAGSRILVQRQIADELAAKLAERFAAPVPAATWDDPAGFPPIISERQLSRIDGIVGAAVAKGAEILCGGTRFDRAGSFYRPTLIGGVDAASPAVTEEIFGPVATFQVFDSEEEAMELAAHPTYGLCAGLHTRDLSRAMRLTRRLEAGTVWVNRYGRTRDHILPTGGWKASGLGKDLGREAYLSSLKTKTVLMDL